MTTRLVIGCMTGTSLDGLDLAAVEIDGHGPAMHARVLEGSSTPLADLAAPLRSLASQQPATAGDIATLARAFSELHARAIADLTRRFGKHPSLICIHGQTVFHRPPASWQLLTPAVIAHALNIAVVSDVRAMDLAAGGQGAPVTPLADWVLYRAARTSAAVVNLGGFSNITLLADDPAAIRGRDVCACNQLLDDIARKVLGEPYDHGGAAALAGTVHDDALEDLDGVLRAQAAARRSLGTGDELTEWVSRWRAHIAPNDLAATACEGIGQAIADATRGCDRLILAGGGVHNAALVRSITSCASCRVDVSDGLGVPAALREAAEFAVLGALCADAVPITLPAVTGVTQAPIAGTWVFPRGPRAFIEEWSS